MLLREITWKQSGTAWFISKFEERFRPLKHAESRIVLNYDAFEVNPPLSDDIFRLSALDLPKGARIVDHRHAGVSYRFDDPVKTNQKTLDEAVGQLKRTVLPRISDDADGSPQRVSRGRVIVLCIAIVLMALGSCLLARKWWKLLRPRSP